MFTSRSSGGELSTNWVKTWELGNSILRRRENEGVMQFRWVTTHVEDASALL